ncbi:MAG: L-threonylcarbamoyladenylate synthase [Gaiellaceae bacterium]
MIEDIVGAIRAGEPVLLPMDTVYGLCADPYRSDAARRLYRVKQRDELEPIAFLAGDLELLLECVPELRGRSGTIARALLPGPYTLVFPNPARRYRWLTGGRPDTIGVRVPDLRGDARAVLDRVGALAATSANLSGGPDPARLADVPQELRAAAGAELDGGELPGVPSTVLDFTGPEPRVLREGAAPGREALERSAHAVA